MLVITGDTRSKKLIEDYLIPNGMGRMVIGNAIKPYPGEPWCFDNGAFMDWRKGIDFDSKRYLKRLEMAKRIAENMASLIWQLYLIRSQQGLTVLK